MNNHGWSVSISVVLLWLLCQCGNGTGDDGGPGIGSESGGSGNKSIAEQPLLLVKISPSASTTTATSTRTANNSTSTTTTLLSTGGLSPTTISTNAGVALPTGASPSTTITQSTSTSSRLLSESKLSSENNGTSPFLLKASQLKNDNETVASALESTQQPSSSSSSSSSTAATSTSTSFTSSTSVPPTTPFPPSTNIHHDSQELVTSIPSQHQQQQRSKLWAPHSSVADFINGLEEDAGTNSTGNYGAIPSSNSDNSTTSHKSNAHLPSEKVQQTRSIRSIRLIAHNNNTSGRAPLHHGESQQARDDGGDGISSTKNVDENRANDGVDEDGAVVFHVNNNKFPAISSIRHYRSRKSFSRTRTSTKSSLSSDGGSIMRENLAAPPTFTSAHNDQPTRQLKKVKTFASKLSFSRPAVDDQTDHNENRRGDEENEDDDEEEATDSFEKPQGDQPQRSDEEDQQEVGDDEAIQDSHHGYYYGRVASRRNTLRSEESEENFRNGDTPASLGAGGNTLTRVSSSREHYGKVMDKPVMLRGSRIIASKEGQKSGYSFSDDTAHYEKSYFIPKDVSSSSSSETTGDGGEENPGRGNAQQENTRKRPNQSSGKNANSNAPTHRSNSEDEKNTTILHKINKTFLSRSRSRHPQQLGDSDSDHEEKYTFPETGSLNTDLLLGNKAPDLNSPRHWPHNIAGQEQDKSHLESNEAGISSRDDDDHNTKGALPRVPISDSSKEINSFPAPSPSGTIVNSHWNPSSSFFPGASNNNNMATRDKLKGSLNDSDYVIGESGKSHSLGEEEGSPNENHSTGTPPPKNNKQQRNRNNGQSRGKNKERRKQKGYRRPATAVASVSNDAQNGSGSPSDANNFHTSQGNLDQHVIFFAYS